MMVVKRFAALALSLGLVFGGIISITHSTVAAAGGPGGGWTWARCS